MLEGTCLKCGNKGWLEDGFCDWCFMLEGVKRETLEAIQGAKVASENIENIANGNS